MPGYPVAYFCLAVTDADVAHALGQITYTADRIVIAFHDDGPHGAAAEDGTDGVKTLLHVLVGSPTGTRP